MMQPESPNYNIWRYTRWSEDDCPQPPSDVDTCGAGSLDQRYGATDLSYPYSAEQMMLPRLVEDAGASRPVQVNQFSHPALATPPSPLAQTPSPPFGAALHLPHAAGHLIPGSSGIDFAQLHLWPFNRAPPTFGLGQEDFFNPCPCAPLSSGHICAHTLHPAAALDEAATEAAQCNDGAYDIQPSSGTYSVAPYHTYGSSLVPSYAGPFVNQSDLFNGDLGSPQRAPWLSIPAAGTPVHDPYLPVPPSPAPLADLTTSDSSEGSPDRVNLSIPSSPRRKRRQRATPYARSSRAGSSLGSSTELGDAVAIENARGAVRQWVKSNPHALEPSIGNPAAIPIIGSNLRLGTLGKSLYSAFFFSHSGKQPPFTCYECGHEEKRFSRAVRHQRQDHFGHYPFLCQGGSGHPACGQWFASDEYATDHVKKAGPTTFVCFQCSKVFSNSGNLGRHRKQVHDA